MRQRRVVPAPGPATQPLVGGTLNSMPQRPKRSPVGIFGALLFAPGAIKVHEAPESLAVFVPGMLEERSVRHAPAHALIVGQLGRYVHKHQRPLVVIEAVPV